MSPKTCLPSSQRASQATAASSAARLGPMAIWNRFRMEAEARVRECNAVAGERLWAAKVQEPMAFRLVVESTGCPEDSIECTLDAAAGVLSCRPGPALTAGCCEFRIAGEGMTLRMGDSEYTISEALALILDELVFVHGDC